MIIVSFVIQTIPYHLPFFSGGRKSNRPGAVSRRPAELTVGSPTYALISDTAVHAKGFFLFIGIDNITERGSHADDLPTAFRRATKGRVYIRVARYNIHRIRVCPSRRYKPVLGRHSIRRSANRFYGVRPRDTFGDRPIRTLFIHPTSHRRKPVLYEVLGDFKFWHG